MEGVRNHFTVKACGEENRLIRYQNAALLAENAKLEQEMLARSCFTCVRLVAHAEQSSEKRSLLIENAMLKTVLSELSRGAVLPLSVPSIRDGGGWRGVALALRGMVLSAATTVWLPSTLPQHVFDYLRDWRHHGEWDTHMHGATVKELAYISTGGYLKGNAVSVLRPNVTDGTNSNILILQDASTDVSCSLVVYSPIEENAMLAVMNGGDHTSSFLLPSGFAVLPDGHGLAHHSPSTSSAFATAGSLVTVACQTLLPGITTDNLATEAFDDAGKQLCHAIGKIRAAVEADIIVPA
ncbi:homeobox-leucine zipper protein ROC6-like [Phragmites australis]|uniref:homeobox-leucine zipper protein ROC6-like n=1 Tax=Phragmites australis TaxID=29695 RepID=UPI002D769342|nr:homeobox-leucine zipper protein ROC6-like [Phragmites australis]